MFRRHKTVIQKDKIEIIRKEWRFYGAIYLTSVSVTLVLVSFACIRCIKDIIVLEVGRSKMINLNTGMAEECTHMQLNGQSLKAVTK